MANEEHLKILRQGVDDWNWRRVEAKILKPDFSGADLRGADLSGAALWGAVFSRAKLNTANFNSANLNDVDFSGADLTGANLQKAELLAARLFFATLDEANLTETHLWETQRAGWSIRNVICESVFWNIDGKEKTVYAPGEFERLFADKTRIKIVYKHGISTHEIVTLPSLIQHLADSHPGSKLRLESIKNDSGGAVVELSIEGDDDYSPEQMKQLKTALEAEAQQRVEYQRLALAEKEKRLELQGAIGQLNIVIDKLINRPTLLIKGDVMAEKKEGDVFNITGTVGAAGTNAHAHHMTFNTIVNNVEQSVDFAALATQLAELRQAIMAKQDSSPQAAIAIGKVAEAEIAATEKNSSKVVESLKAAGKWTLDFAKEIGKDLIVDVIKQSMGKP